MNTGFSIFVVYQFHVISSYKIADSYLVSLKCLTIKYLNIRLIHFIIKIIPWPFYSTVRYVSRYLNRSLLLCIIMIPGTVFKFQ